MSPTRKPLSWLPPPSSVSVIQDSFSALNLCLVTIIQGEPRSHVGLALSQAGLWFHPSTCFFFLEVFPDCTCQTP